MAVYGYTKNYKLIKPQFDTDTWHDYEYDNLDTIDAVLSAIFASGDWQGFWKTNTHYDAGGVVIDRVTDTMYKIMVEHTTSEATFAEEFAAHPTYYELWSPNQLAEDWAIKMDGVVSNTDYSSKAYAISSALIDAGSAKEWAIKTDNSVGTTGEYSAKKHATDAASSASTATSQASAALASATLSSQWAVSPTLVASTDYSSKSWATGSLDAGSAKDWAIKEGGQVGTTGKYSAKVYSLAAQNHYEKAVDWASKTNGLVEGTDYSAKAYAISEGLISDGSAKEWSNKAKAWATSSTIVEDGKYGASYYALQAYNANVTAQIAKTTAQEWASKTDAQVASTDYSSKAYAQSEGLISSGSSKEWATKSSTWAEGSDADVAVLGGTHSSKGWTDNSYIWAEGTDEQVQALGGVHSSKVWAEQSTNANIALTNSPYTTNRILEIPQDIKLELNNGTLTLKAGSKVYDGNSNSFSITSDITKSGLAGGDVQQLLLLKIDGTTLVSVGVTDTDFAYNSSTGYVHSNTYGDYYLPIALTAHNTGTGVYTSIDQIFNGFGYIGSTVFALPNIKVQGAFGVNEDGTYKLKEFVTDRVLISSFDSNIYGRYTFGFDVVENGTITYFGAYANDLQVGEKQPSGANFAWWNPVKGETHYVNSSGIDEKIPHTSPRLGFIILSGGRISSMEQNPIDSIVTSNALNFSQVGRSYLSGLGLPSDQAQQLTLLASGQSYTAPANGWFSVIAVPYSNGYILLNRSDSTMRSFYQNTEAGPVSAGVFLPVLEGTSVSYTYSGPFYNNSNSILFIPAKGEN